MGVLALGLTLGRSLLGAVLEPRALRQAPPRLLGLVLELTLKGGRDARVLIARGAQARLGLVGVHADHRAGDQRDGALLAQALAAQLDAEWQDLSMPGLAVPRGKRHPLTEVENRCMDVMRLLGFELVDGPEVEHPYYNFDALNIPKHHPARDMQDTFWVDGRYLLRSHTTTVQARVLESTPELPVRVCSLGRVYRNEAVDATHLAMFHQFEGIWVDEGLTFGDLKGVLAFIAKELFGDRPVRFKPKFYPYTEPSVGVDIQCGACNGTREVDGQPCEACHAAGWVTILGSGMIHPKMLIEFGYDPDEVSGIAFGLGTTRMAAQWTGVGKVKSLYEQDQRVFTALHRGAGEGGAA